MNSEMGLGRLLAEALMMMGWVTVRLAVVLLIANLVHLVGVGARRDWRLASEIALPDVALDGCWPTRRYGFFDFGEVHAYGLGGVKC